MNSSANLRFPNQVRSYRTARGVVQFWGSDETIEVTFYVSASALKHLQPDLVSDEAGFLRAFDTNRERIERAATKAYQGGQKTSYDLDLPNF